MPAIAVGSVRIDEIVESFLIAQPTVLLPDATPAALAPHLGWLRPKHIREDGAMILPVRTYVVRTPEATIVVDTCLGSHAPRSLPGVEVRQGEAYLDGLRSLGVAPTDVDYVMCTHMHFDHVGWNTRRLDGRWVPTFPKARYLFARREWAHYAEGASERQRAVLRDHVAPVLDAGLAALVETDHVIGPGIRFEPLPGHTPGHVGLRVRSEGQEAVLTGDMMHHPVQVAEPGWPCTACDDPAEAVRTRRAFVARTADSGTLVLAAHFNAAAGGFIVRRGGGTRFEEPRPEPA